ncbi:Y-family DNA polymerase [Lachnospiraceae bacterium LCP25S3_G4]
MGTNKSYVCIDLKSFYASVECKERRLDPMTTNLVVADPERTDKTICLAVSPAMKALGVPGRCRVFEIPKSIPYIMAPPRMQLYIDYAAGIYKIYLKYISKEDIHVYSIDEVFIDVTDYLPMYQMDVKELVCMIMQDISNTMGIMATAGIGTNMYLAKVALDIIAKHSKDGIGVLDTESYQKLLWNHKPLTDFWRIGKGVANQLERMGITTMGEIAKADEKTLYGLFGIDAELLFDHAWGLETTTMQDIKSYKPKANSISSGQVLPRDYQFEEGKLIVKEMADLLCLDLVYQKLVTNSITLHISYTRHIEEKSAHGTVSLPITTSSARKIIDYAVKLYEQIVNRQIPIRRVNITFNHVQDEAYQQYDLFTEPLDMEKEHQIQKAILEVKERFGKNAILKGMNLQTGATTVERNCQIGGHKSGVKDE